VNVSSPFGVESVSVFDALSNLMIVPLAILGAGTAAFFSF
jgi:hypothetical protein